MCDPRRHKFTLTHTYGCASAHTSSTRAPSGVVRHSDLMRPVSRMSLQIPNSASSDSYVVWPWPYPAEQMLSTEDVPLWNRPFTIKKKLSLRHGDGGGRDAEWPSPPHGSSGRHACVNNTCGARVRTSTWHHCLTIVIAASEAIVAAANARVGETHLLPVPRARPRAPEQPRRRTVRGWLPRTR